jgi:hypothetical protein
MSLVQRWRRWWQIYFGQDATPLESDAPAWVISLVLHLVGLVVLASFTFLLPSSPEHDLVLSKVERLNELPDAYRFSDDLTPQIGALGNASQSQSLAAAPLESELATVSTEVKPLSDFGQELVNVEDPVASAPDVELDRLVRGMATIAETGVAGAVDRITHEILLSLEVSPTLVVWMFDQSGSLRPQREAIASRFDQIYEELGVFEAAANPAFAKHEHKPLLSAVVAYASAIHFLTDSPTDDVGEIKEAVRSVTEDPSGQERVFQAVATSVERYAAFRTRSKEPRKIMIVIFTDEAGDDLDHLERAVDVCRRQEIPVYVVGAPAPFGREEVYVKYIDPDPNFDQSPQWLPVRQGPESVLPERLKLRFAGAEALDEPIDSGFGPYGLTRLCNESDGLYFSVHPGRAHGGRLTPYSTPDMTAYLAQFFDPARMRRYRPDCVPLAEYRRKVAANRACTALVEAARLSWTTPPEETQLVFPVTSEAELASALTLAQRESARVEPRLQQLYDILRQGEADRAGLVEPRWQAGYDLAIGRTLAVKARTQGYNLMLAMAKQGMKFKNDRNDTWVLEAADAIEAGSAIEKQAERAKEYLNRVVTEHGGTPWAWLAERELAIPIGWKWTERYTGVRPSMQQVAGDAGPFVPRDDVARVAPPARPRRAPPAL